eukprot:7699634-Pyramimonas_sp.AAC.1
MHRRAVLPLRRILELLGAILPQLPRARPPCSAPTYSPASARPSTRDPSGASPRCSSPPRAPAARRPRASGRSVRSRSQSR